MKIAVLVKQVPDTWGDRHLSQETGLLIRDEDSSVPDEIGERALEHALRHKDANPDTEVVLVTMGPEMAESALRKLLALGPDSAVQVTDPSLGGADVVATAKVLAATLRRIQPDLVLAGNESTDGRGGLVPAMIGEINQMPVLPGLDSVELADGEVSGTASADGVELALRATLPAIVTITEKSAEQRLPNFKGVLSAKKKPLEQLSLAELDCGDVAQTGARTVMVAASKRPPKQAGPRIPDDGTAAAQLAGFLRDRRLI